MREERRVAQGRALEIASHVYGASAILVSVTPALAVGAQLTCGTGPGRRHGMGVSVGGSLPKVSFLLSQLKVQLLSPCMLFVDGDRLFQQPL